MSNTTEKKPSRYMGYYNHHTYPVCAMMGNRRLELEAGEPVLTQTGEPVESHPDLDVLVQQGMLKGIPRGDQKWQEVFNQTRRLSGTRVATPVENNERAKTVATNMGLSREQADLPPGAEYVTEGRGQVIQYQGRKFPSVAALNAYLNSQNNG